MVIDYVLAACRGYPRKVYERFVGSLFDTGYDGAAVLFVGEGDLPEVAPVAAGRPGISVEVLPPSDRQLALARYAAVRDFLRSRLDVALPQDDSPVQDGLPVEIDLLAQWGVGDRLLADLLAGVDPARAREQEWRRGVMPPSMVTSQPEM